MQPLVIRFRRERRITPDGCAMLAPLSDGIDGQFRPHLRRFVLAQHHQGQVTLARVVTLRDAVGTAIFRIKVVRLLIDGKDSFKGKARDALRAGLETAALGDGR